MRTSELISVPRRRAGKSAQAHAAGLPSYTAATQPSVSAARRLENALAELQDLRHALESSERRIRAAEQHAEVLKNALQRQDWRADRHDGDAAADLPWTSTCRAKELPSPPGIAGPGGECLPWARTRIAKAQVLYRAGDRLDALYAVRFGSCKTVLLSKNGQDQVVGFSIVGDVIGTDGIAAGFHTCQATALEDTEVFQLPLDSIEYRVLGDRSFAREFHSMLSNEGARAHVLMLVLGSMRAEQRLAFFLLDLAARYQSRGYSSQEFVLRMSRQEIGSYLGLKLETVSRTFSRFQRDGMLRIDGRSIVLLDRASLSRVMNGD